jgi:hypothetical protein
MSDLTAIDDDQAILVFTRRPRMHTHPAPCTEPPLPTGSIAPRAEGRRAQYLLLSGLLMLVPGVAFERHRHPATILDLATGPRTSVWGWWSEPVDGEPPVPCLLWAGDLGWSATTVEPDVFDTEGYERSSWSHRITLLDLAIANATGPLPTLEALRRRVSDDLDPNLGDRAVALGGALLWGIVQQQAARTRLGDVAGDPSIRPSAIRGSVRGTVDDALDREQLGPDRVKIRLERADAGLDGLVRAVAQVRTGSSLRARLLHGHAGWRRVGAGDKQSA